MLKTAISIFLGIICTEAITELIVHSVIFKPIRDYISSLSNFTHELVGCGYCISVWAAMFCSFLVAPLTLPTHFFAANWLIWTLTFHRLSNFLNDFADRYISDHHSEDAEMFKEADKFFGIESNTADSP